MTALFWFLAAALAAAGIGFLAWPLLRAAPPPRLDRRAATLAAHRARLAEIEGGEEGSAEDAATGREARDDIARSLLRDLDPDGRGAADASRGATLPARARPRRGAAIALGVAVPLLAAGLYLLLGEPRGLDPSSVPVPAPSAEAIGEEVRRLLAEAEALGRANRDRLDGEPARLIDRALALAPDHRKALWFGAVAALHENRAEDARTRLDRLRSLGPFDATETRMFEQLMKETNARLPGG